MKKTICVPALGEQKQTETQVNFWYVEEGQRIQAGDDLTELVTDKAAFNLPAPEECQIVKILAAEGARVKEGEALVEVEVGE